MIEDADWTDPVRLEARVAGVVARNRAHLADPVLAPMAFRRLVEDLSRALGAAGIPDPQAVAWGLLQAALDRARVEGGEALEAIARVKRRRGYRKL